MKIRLLTLLLPLTALAAVQGPDTGGYSATDAAVFSFVDISGGGGGTSILSATDDGTVNVTMPFSFQFYGTGYTNLCVSSNGAVYLLSDPSVCAGINDFANTDLSSGAPPTDQPALFPLWSDLTFQTAGAGSVFYQTLGTAPNRRFIVQWNNAYPQGSASAVTFQVVLTETSNAIAFQYQTVSVGAGDPASNGALATIGIRNASAQTTGQQLQWAFNSAVLTDATALLFTQGAGPLPPALVTPSSGSTTTAAPVSLIWTASAGATSYDVYFGSTNPPPLVANVAGTSFAAGGTYSTSYNWQIIAKNGAGSGASPIRSFTTVAAPAPSGGGGGTVGFGSNPLTVSPNTLTLSAPFGGGSIKRTATISYQTYTQGAPTYTSNATTNQGFGWLSVTPATGTMKEASFAGFLYTYTADVTISIDATSLSAGASYQGNANFSAGNGIASVAVTANVGRADAPVVSQGGVVPVYSTSTTVQPGSWISIYGANLAASTVIWQGEFPVSLGGVSVTVNGKPGYLWLVSPTQINLQAPDDISTGSVDVVVTTPTGTFTSSVTLGPASPSLSLLDSKHVAALVQNAGGGFDTVGPPGAFPYATRPIAAGETLILYGVGYGPTDPPVKAGRPVNTAAVTVNPVTVTIGGVSAAVTYSGLVGPGLYQINATVPDGLPSGDQAIRTSVLGFQTGPGPVVTIR